MRQRMIRGLLTSALVTVLIGLIGQVAPGVAPPSVRALTGCDGNVSGAPSTWTINASFTSMDGSPDGVSGDEDYADLLIYWGDGTTDFSEVTSPTSWSMQHTYASGGSYNFYWELAGRMNGQYTYSPCISMSGWLS